MNPNISQNSQAILLLTAPLMAGSGKGSSDVLTLGEYNRLTNRLRELKRKPADFLQPEPDELLISCQSAIDPGRLRRLLGRGFALSQAIEYWQARAIWVLSRADIVYPPILRTRLKEYAPSLLYGCGNISLVEKGGLAVVGSRHVGEELVEYAEKIGALTAHTEKNIISGGAKGIDQAAMRGALRSGGNAVGILSDSLEKTAMNREHRNLIRDGKLLLLSPYDPNVGFNVGNAMQRNKLIYAFSDAALIVNSDLNEGGTWAGAKEQLDKYRFIPVFVRSIGTQSPGLDALRKKGASPWPNPQNPEALQKLLDASSRCIPRPALQPTITVFATDASTIVSEPAVNEYQSNESTKKREDFSNEEAILTSDDEVFNKARDILKNLLTTPMQENDIAAAINTTRVQARKILKQFVEEGFLEKLKKPVRYIIQSPSLFDFPDEEIQKGQGNE